MSKSYLYLIIFLSQIIFCTTTIFSQNSLLESITIEHNTIIIQPSNVCAEKYFTTPEFIVEYDSHEDLSGITNSVAAIPFIMCIAPSIWLTGDIFKIDEMDADLYYTLKRIKKIFTLFYPQFSWNGNIIPHKLVYNRTATPVTSDQTALLFSGGLDSTTLSLALQEYKQLLLTIQGLDIPFDDTARWLRIQQANSSFAHQHGHTNAFIRFNGRQIINYNHLTTISETLSKWWWWDYILGAMGFIGVAAPLVHKKGYKDIYIASSSTISYPYAWNSHPLLDNNMHIAGIAVHHRHEEFTRLAKVQRVVHHTQQYGLPLPKLRVCWRDKQGGNCCSCVNKCLMTIHDILAEGQEYQQFGFPISFEELQTKMHQAFDGSKKYSGEVIDDWCDIQQRIHEVLASENAECVYTPEVKTHLTWLANLDLAAFDDGKNESLEKQKEFFTKLWQLGQQGRSEAVFDTNSNLI